MHSHRMLSTKQSTKTATEFKSRLKGVVIKYSAILLVGVAYLVFVLCTGLRIPCPFYEITDLKCPGCGISRMFAALARLDFIAAFKYNPFVFITGPLLVTYLVLCETEYVKHGSESAKRWNAFLYAELFLALAYGVLRNVFPNII